MSHFYYDIYNFINIKLLAIIGKKRENINGVETKGGTRVCWREESPKALRNNLLVRLH